MAFHCDAPDKYIGLAANSNLYLTNQYWTVAGWIKFDAATSVTNRYVMTFGTPWTTNSVLILMVESDDATYFNKLRLWMTTDAGGWRGDYSSDTSFATTAWQHFIFLQSSNNTYLYRNNVVKLTKWAPTAGQNLDPVAPFLIGGPGGTLDGQIAEWAAWDRVLNSAERQMLADGASPELIPRTLNWHFKGIRDLREERHGIVVTNNNACPVLPHPRIFYNRGMWLPHKAAAAPPSGISILRRRRSA